MVKKSTLTFVLLFVVTLATGVHAGGFNQTEQKKFINEMVTDHGFEKPELEALFKKAKRLDKVLEAISRPAEKSKEWYEYRKIFLTTERIDKGVAFWQDNRDLLLEVEKQYGVAREIIVAIIGVETYYGKHKGKYRVIDALATLAFDYPPRAKFFRGELKQFLLFTRELEINPVSLNGSYAGAMGMPQFIPSSFKSYAVDFDKDGRIDIWSNRADIFASVANYFKRHGWMTGEPVATATWVKKDSDLKQYIENGLKPSLPLSDLTNSGIQLKRQIEGNPLSSLLVFKQEKGKDYWVAFQNFYSITRYNHSQLYAMAVFQLSEAIKEAYVKAALLK